MLSSIHIKTSEEIKIMKEGGEKLLAVKSAVTKAITSGISAYDIDKLADELIIKQGGTPSFKKVPGYYWATCVNVNAGIVHGVPKREIIFKKGDIVSVDMGMYYKGFHTDTSISVGIDAGKEIKEFLKAGEIALRKAIKKAKVGGRIYDISESIELVIKGSGFSPVLSLVGHGVGRNLHEEPQIPCFVYDERENTPKILEGMTLAIEVMYTKGKPELVHEDDGWTISTADGKISGLFEETVAVSAHGPVVLTA